MYVSTTFTLGVGGGTGGRGAGEGGKYKCHDVQEKKALNNFPGFIYLLMHNLFILGGPITIYIVPWSPAKRYTMTIKIF